VRWAAALLAVFLSSSAFGGDVSLQALPPEARETLVLIERNGPFPHLQDGRTFGNREKRLPLRGQGYYREYTVRTPGEHDRGARRIVAGNGGEYYYTDDHYRSFRRIRR
jgi:ribonuclease T1